MSKESTESIQSLTVFNDDIALLKSTGCSIKVDNKDTSMMVNIQSHMMDRKASNLLLGLGGVYCDLCDLSKEECLNPEQIEKGFEITREIESLHTIFADLGQDDGSVLKEKMIIILKLGLHLNPSPLKYFLYKCSVHYYKPFHGDCCPFACSCIRLVGVTHKH